MKKVKFERGQRVIYIKGNILQGKLVIDAYFLEECDDIEGEFILTSNINRVESFTQKNRSILLDEEIFFEKDYKKILKFSDKLFKKYQNLNIYLLENNDIYHNATRYLLFRDDFQELYNVFGDKEELYRYSKNKRYHKHSDFCKRLIKTPYFVTLRFIFNISWKYILGTFKQIFYLLFFIKDLIVNLYIDYFNYRATKHELKKYEKEIEYKPRNEMQQKINNEGKEWYKKNIEEKKAIYVKSNIAFFTLFIAVIVFIFTMVINTNNLNKKDVEINLLKNNNDRLEQEIVQLKNNVEMEILVNQNLLNNNLVFSINYLTEIIKELKKENEELENK